jgi:hypothetical protein
VVEAKQAPATPTPAQPAPSSQEDFSQMIKQGHVSGTRGSSGPS